MDLMGFLLRFGSTEISPDADCSYSDWIDTELLLPRALLVQFLLCFAALPPAAETWAVFSASRRMRFRFVPYVWFPFCRISFAFVQ